MTSVFVAYASGNNFHETVIREAAEQASTTKRTITPWSEKDTSGYPIAKSVEAWIESADAFISDISYVNMNVTYEIGYAMGLGKPVRLVRSTHADFSEVRAVGLFDTLGHDSYDFQPALRKILGKQDEVRHWGATQKNKDQPVFILHPPEPTDWSRRVVSGIKKIVRLKFRGFNPAEISRLNAGEAYEHTAASFGVVTFWMEGSSDSAVKSNQRSAFIFGLARGLGIPAILVAHESSRLPLDLHDQAARWLRFDDLDGLISDFRILVADSINDFVYDKDDAPANTLESINFGDPVAENEASILRDFFLKTDGYNRTKDGDAHVLVGRKGSGKSAVFLQVRDNCRANKNNIVVDLMPEGYQLIKLKEHIIDRLSLGAKKEVIAAFWEYILWLEIAYKILEKDALRAKRDHELLKRYDALLSLFRKRVDTGVGDFSERLRLLSDNIIHRFSSHFGDQASDALKSSEVLEIVYGQDVAELRDAILEYLGLKGFVLFLFDNLDRIWTPGGFRDEDAIILIGLIEAMQEIYRKFRKRSLDLRWAIFVRSDVYEFLIRGMADYGKLSVQSLEWGDREQLQALFNQRLRANLGSTDLADIWREISDQVVKGVPVVEFLIDGSLMRPRYLIRLFETARRRALTFERKKITDADYRFALSELGWQVLEDLDREIADLVVDGEALLFEILTHRSELTVDKLRYIAGKKISSPDDVERLLDVMLWNGSLGVRIGGRDTFIYDCGYKRQYLASSISADAETTLVLHPTLCAALDTPHD